MSIYLFSIMPEGFKELTLPEGQTFLQHNCLRWSGESKMANWSKPELVWLQDELTTSSDIDADFIKFSGAVVISEKARSVLAEPLNQFVEFLPVTVDGMNRYILNVTNVINIMDKEKSIYKIYSDGNIGECEHAFLNEPEPNALIYKVSGFLGRLFVSDGFKGLVEVNNLTGALIREYKNP